MASGVYLKRRHEWVIRLIKGGVPVQPSMGDRGPVMDALYDLVDAAGPAQVRDGYWFNTVTGAKWDDRFYAPKEGET